MKANKNQGDIFSDALGQILLAIKTATSYPENHPILGRIIDQAHKNLANLLSEKPTLTVTSSGDRLLVDDIPMDNKNSLFANFNSDLGQNGIESITFYQGLSYQDFKTFLYAMTKGPDTPGKMSDVAGVLQNQGITTIKLNHLKYGKITEESEMVENILKYFNGEKNSLGDSEAIFFVSWKKNPKGSQT